MGAAGPGWPGRAPAVRWLLLLMVFVSLPCYVWFAVQPRSGLGWPLAATPSSSPLALPYQLLNASEPPPLDELAGLAPDDESALMDLHDFRWLLGGGRGGGDLKDRTPTPCRPLVLLLVHTALDHSLHRALIRETWGSPALAPRGEVLVRFLVGQPSGGGEEADATQRRVAEEAATFGDLVQGSFVDSYRNMTYKHAMALKWFATRCPEATYLLKVDDDVLVNTPVLLDFVRNVMSPFGARRLLACSVLEHARPKRTWRSKWHVGYREYKRDEYPTYCAGWAVLFSPDVAFALYREVQREPYFWIDDVLVTGVLAERIGVMHASWSKSSLVLASEDLPRVLAGDQRPDFIVALWADLGADMEVQKPLWRRILVDMLQGQGNATRDSRDAWEDRDRSRAAPSS